MDNQFKGVFSAWLVVIGTISSAIGSTPLHFIKSSLRQDLNLWGNVLQAVGNSVQKDGDAAIETAGDGQENVPLGTIGNEIQSFGNISVIAGLIIKCKDETQKKLIITGNWMQALGGSVVAGHELEDVSDTDKSYYIVGNLLQVIGNSLQALDGIQDLENSQVEEIETDKERKENRKDKESEENKDSKENKEDKDSVTNRKDEDKWSLEVIGSWIQATGSIICLIGEIREEREENIRKKEQENKDTQTEKLTSKKEEKMIRK